MNLDLREKKFDIRLKTIDGGLLYYHDAVILDLNEKIITFIDAKTQSMLSYGTFQIIDIKEKINK